MPVTPEFLMTRFEEAVNARDEYAATLLAYGPINPTKKEATMNQSTTPNRYRYNVTIDIDAMPGTLDATSSSSTLENFLASSTVWQQASRRNPRVTVTREVIAYGKSLRVTVQGLPDQFKVVNKYGHEFDCIKVGDRDKRVVVNGTTGLHDFPAAVVQSHLDSGTWVVS